MPQRFDNPLSQPSLTDATTALDTIILQLANAAAHDTGNVTMPWREELALGAAALAGFRAIALRQQQLHLIGFAVSVVDGLRSEGRLSPTVRLVEDVSAPGTFARMLRPEYVLGRPYPFASRFVS